MFSLRYLQIVPLAFLASPVAAPLMGQGDWTASLSAGYESRHIYRGVDSGQDGSITWQTTAVTSNNLTLGYWYGTGPTTA